MKKLLLTLLAVALCVGVSVAQRRTDYCNVSIGWFTGTCKYSYVLRNGARVYDGPVSVTADDYQKKSIGFYGTYYTFRYHLDYSLTANNSNGRLSGPIKLKSVDRSYGGGQPEELDTKTLSGNFVAGLPSGKFVYNYKKSRDGATRQVENYSVTFNKGLLTGAFLWQTGDNEIRGSFTSSGKLNGKWSVKGKTYQFKNGVLIEGEGLSSQEKSYAIKFANNQITEQQLFDNGMIVEERDLGVCEELISRLKGSVCQADPLETADFDRGNVGDNYKVISQATFFTEKGYNDFVERFIHSGKRIDPDEYIASLDHFTCLDKDRGMRYGVEYSYNGVFEHTGAEWVLPGMARGYYFTKDQLERVKKEVEKHNKEVVKYGVEKILAKPIQIGGRTYQVISSKLLKKHDSGYGMTLEINCVPNSSQSSKSQKPQAYATYEVVADLDSHREGAKVVLKSFTRIRNKYDDIKALRSELNKADNNAESVAEKIYNSGEVNDYREEFAAQLKSFIDYQSSRKSIAIDHDNLDNTINSYKQHIRITKQYAIYLKYFAKSHKLKAEIQQKGISKYTTTTSPTFPDWNRNITLKEVITVVTEQKNILSKWDELNELKSSAAKNHSEISAAGIPVLSVYNGLYSSIAKAKVSLDESIASYKGLLNTQTSVTDYIPLYKEVVNSNTLLATVLKPAKCAAKAYKTYYKALDLTWKQQDAIESINKVLATQKQLKDISQRPTLKDDEKRVKKLKLTALDDIIKAYNSTPSVQPTTVVKQPEPKAVVTEKKVEAKATEEKRSDVAPSTKAEKRPQSQSLATIQRGFGQYVEISPMFNLSKEGGSFSFNFNYIGGYRFNKNIFLGLGTGLNLNGGQDDWSEFYYNNYGGYNDYYDYYNASLYLLSIPAYLHFRVDWGKRATKWNFYSAFSTGAQFGVYEPYSRFERNYLNNSPLTESWFYSNGHGHQLYDMYRFNGEILFGLDFGANYRLTDKMSLYMGVGIKYGMRTSSITIHSCQDCDNDWGVGGPDLYDMGFGNSIPSIKVTIGLSF